eukprot:TRINITY_DN5422_c0_g1_i1.p1 TRINITY_DN5422_c0_g1~~TRINITY_DN5422_c0_g1_i1.p1  ORF type:complete len:362 (+),score=52.19 TRINITY_DN5422_c0_g1_i1:200-1285(+)
MSDSISDVLVLGGHGFMGRSLVELLLKNGYSVTLVNRGKEHWKSTKPFGDKVLLTKADRKKRDEYSERLRNISHPKRWKVVIDFCAFKAKDIASSISGLKGRVDHYVYISSDSVYEVCSTPSHDGHRRESDAIRPFDETLCQFLRTHDKYGDGKLACEEELEKQYREGGIPYTSLRLPDVFGPYDGTDRHWMYQLWLKVSEQYPVDITESGASKPLSFVFSEDAAAAALAVIETGQPTYGKAFNIAQVETPTLLEYLQTAAEILAITPKFNFETSDNNSDSDSSSESLDEYLPSVNFGPIDISLALSSLPWKPTPFRAALEKTCAFFEDAYFRYHEKIPIEDWPEEKQRSVAEAYANKSSH